MSAAATTAAAAARERALKDRVVNGRIRKSWPSAIAPRILRTGNSRAKGFVNPGVLCYRNAVLQCLLHVPEFFHYLSNAGRCASPGDGCVFCALRGLATQYWTSTDLAPLQLAVTGLNTAMERHSGRNPKDQQAYGFLRGIGSQVNNMAAAGQQDAHEYLLGVLNMLKFNNNSLMADKFMKVAIDRLFRVRCKTTWTCNDCGKIHTRRVKDIGISLVITSDDEAPLSDYLNEHFADESLEGVQCDSDECNNKKQDRVRRTRIVGGPEVLVIQLVRMQMDLRGRIKKVTSRIDYGERLDLSDWSDVPLKYQLHGIVAHRGRSLTKGHYVAMVRCQNGVGFALCNDQQIGDRPSTKQRILALAESKEFQSYLLVYQKVGGKMVNFI